MRPAPVFALILALAPAAAGAASFDCTLPTLTPNELAICNNRDLNDADVQMVTTLHLLSGLFGMGRRGAMMDDQRAWLQGRMACGADVACIRESYARRLQELQAVYDSIDRPL
ncbi:MAG: hypothetical protein H6900_15595 [Rhodobacter sp.]|uniref:lysozyme inhibitor LprI family protein n=1 Tax=Pararhodobacter sp. TaxID=2127056 RepID=UPI001DD0F1DA|nr:hypothetical protein [Pararhodobacter sp.]MCB1346895.1 hypothetical protein [Paracoccaceae bacterium]MCC0074705.1 hypothetical protein [Rhodobacter sp.]HPD93929.1 hypothetical protein [Pararhodobacter sp.]